MPSTRQRHHHNHNQISASVSSPPTTLPPHPPQSQPHYNTDAWVTTTPGQDRGVLMGSQSMYHSQGYGHDVLATSTSMSSMPTQAQTRSTRRRMQVAMDDQLSADRFSHLVTPSLAHTQAQYQRRSGTAASLHHSNMETDTADMDEEEVEEEEEEEEEQVEEEEEQVEEETLEDGFEVDDDHEWNYSLEGHDDGDVDDHHKHEQDHRPTVTVKKGPLTRRAAAAAAAAAAALPTSSSSTLSTALTEETPSHRELRAHRASKHRGDLLSSAQLSHASDTFPDFAATAGKPKTLAHRELRRVRAETETQHSEMGGRKLRHPSGTRVAAVAESARHSIATDSPMVMTPISQPEVRKRRHQTFTSPSHGAHGSALFGLSSMETPALSSPQGQELPGTPSDEAAKRIFTFGLQDVNQVQPFGEHDGEDTPGTAVPFFTSKYDLAEIKASLRRACVDLEERGLSHASKWAAEQLVGINTADIPSSKSLPTPSKYAWTATPFTFTVKSDPVLESKMAQPQWESRTMKLSTRIGGLAGAFHSESPMSVADLQSATSTPAVYPSGSVNRKSKTTAASLAPPNLDLNDLHQDEVDHILLAKSYFSLKQFDRAAHELSPYRSSLALFIRFYSLYLAGEKRREEAMYELKDISGGSVPNKELVKLESELSSLYRTGRMDGFCLYLYGVVLLKSGLEKQAIEVLVKSIHAYPLNWSAWMELASAIKDLDSYNKLKDLLPDVFVLDFFHAHMLLELQQEADSFDIYDNHLSVLFPKSAYIYGCSAVAKYHMQELDEAEILFDKLMENDPFRLEHIDIYSNVLYVKQLTSKLGHLAHKATACDKYRPETCCILGNFFSLIKDSEKAVMYFQRALRLDRNFLAAWTLLGHEFMEMSKGQAAIEAYRRAVDLSPREHRAWYGIGKAYELLGLPKNAIFYYNKVVTLRANDARFWVVLAACHERLEQHENALICYKRGMSASVSHSVPLANVAKLCAKTGKQAEAAHYYRLHIERTDREAHDGESIQEACLFLADYFMQHDHFAEAEAYAVKLLDLSLGPKKEEAQALIRQIKSAKKRQEGGDGHYFGGGGGGIRQAGSGNSGGIHMGGVGMDSGSGNGRRGRTYSSSTFRH